MFQCATFPFSSNISVGLLSWCIDGVTFLLTTSCMEKSTRIINSFSFFYSALDLSKCPQQQVLTCDQPDMVDVLSFENPDEGPVAMIEESLSGNGKSGQNFSGQIKIWFDQVFIWISNFMFDSWKCYCRWWSCQWQWCKAGFFYCDEGEDFAY